MNNHVDSAEPGERRLGHANRALRRRRIGGNEQVGRFEWRRRRPRGGEDDGARLAEAAGDSGADPLAAAGYQDAAPVNSARGSRTVISRSATLSSVSRNR